MNYIYFFDAEGKSLGYSAGADLCDETVARRAMACGAVYIESANQAYAPTSVYHDGTHMQVRTAIPASPNGGNP